MVETPVLYITFARPEYASQSFAAIKKAQPKKLYFYSNKARADKSDEVARNEKVRSYIKQIDWECEVKTWFRDEYVDVFTSLWGAIDWVFDNEEKAIIIEEDVVASLAFFDYVDKLIDKYRYDDKIWFINGNNALDGCSPSGVSYFATRMPSIFGWASWSNRWHKLDRRMDKWPSLRINKSYFKYWGNAVIAFIQGLYFNRYYRLLSADKNYKGPWDWISFYNMVLYNTYAIIPKYNLSADIGVVGDNHKSNTLSMLAKVTYKDSVYRIEKEPEDSLPTGYDIKNFFLYRMKTVLKRNINKIVKF